MNKVIRVCTAASSTGAINDCPDEYTVALLVYGFEEVPFMPIDDRKFTLWFIEDQVHIMGYGFKTFVVPYDDFIDKLSKHQQRWLMEKLRE